MKNILGYEVPLPSRPTITSIIKQLHEKEVGEFITNFKKRDRYTMSITTDISTARNRRSYAVITAHFFSKLLDNNQGFELHEELLTICCLGKKEKHSGENILKFVLKHVYDHCKPGATIAEDKQKADIFKYVIGITADCAGNNGTAFDDLKGCHRIRCFGHRLNTLGGTF